jgi:hypothetical protein
MYRDAHASQWISKHRDNELRRKAMRLLQKLSTASGILPSDLFIQGVDIGPNRDPVARGGFADIFLGTYKDGLVAVKRLHVMGEDKATIHPVWVGSAGGRHSAHRSR